jgi:cytochrome c oxidase subunit II
MLFGLVLVLLTLAGCTMFAIRPAWFPLPISVEALLYDRQFGGNSLGIDPADPDGKDDIVTASLRVPAGRDVLLLLHSRDVIHDFFVRELRTKQDIVPGIEIPLEIHVDRPGEYEIACAELCGLGHSQMRSLMIVMEAEAFDKWKVTAPVMR